MPITSNAFFWIWSRTLKVVVKAFIQLKEAYSRALQIWVLYTDALPETSNLCVMPHSVWCFQNRGLFLSAVSFETEYLPFDDSDVTFHLSAYIFMLSKSLFRLALAISASPTEPISQNNVESSAFRNGSISHWSAESSVKTEKSRGPSSEPWGTDMLRIFQILSC